MKITPFAISEIMLLEPKVFADELGFFFESFKQHQFETAICKKVQFIQENKAHELFLILFHLHQQVVLLFPADFVLRSLLKNITI